MSQHFCSDCKDERILPPVPAKIVMDEVGLCECHARARGWRPNLTEIIQNLFQQGLDREAIRDQVFEQFTFVCRGDAQYRVDTVLSRMRKKQLKAGSHKLLLRRKRA